MVHRPDSHSRTFPQKIICRTPTTAHKVWLDSRVTPAQSLSLSLSLSRVTLCTVLKGRPDELCNTELTLNYNNKQIQYLFVYNTNSDTIY